MHPQQPSRPSESIPWRGVRPGHMLRPADRRMLQAVRDNLSHVRQRVTSSAARQDRDISLPPSQNGMYFSCEGSTTNTSTTVSSNQTGGSRLNYNKKAMDEIRQSLQSYHMASSYDTRATAVPSPLSNGVPASTNDNFIKQVVLPSETTRDAFTMSASRNVDKFWEVATVIAQRDSQVTSSLHPTSSNTLLSSTAATRFNNSIGADVLRRPSFEEKYRCTSSPAGSDKITDSSRSDSPIAMVWDGLLPADLQPVTTVVHRTHNVARDSEILSMAGRPFVAVRSRTRSPTVASSRPVSGPPRQFITTPQVPQAVSSAIVPSVVASAEGMYSVTVPSATAHGMPFATVPSTQGMYCVMSSAPAVSSISSTLPAHRVSCTTVPGLFVSPPDGFKVAVATPLPPAQHGFATSPLDCRSDVDMLSSVVVCSAPLTNATRLHSGRPPTVVLQQVHSCEVSWPTAQRATLPTRATCDSSADSATPACHVPTTLLTQPACDSAADSAVMTSDLCHITPETIVSSSLCFAPPPCSIAARSVINVSPLSLSHLSSASSSPTIDIPPTAVPPPSLSTDKPPPPPYPGRAPIHNPRPLRPAPPPPPISAVAPLTSDVQLSASLSDGDTPAVDVDTAGPAAADYSSDEDAAAATECQRIESPKPVRRAGVNVRCENKIMDSVHPRGACE